MARLKNSCPYLLLTKGRETLFYYEYQNEVKIDSVIFDERIYFDVLEESNDKVISLNKLWNNLRKKPRHLKLTKDQLLRVIAELETKFLIYSSKSKKQIVSIINTKNVK